jgi:acylphosphatase
LQAISDPQFWQAGLFINHITLYLNSSEPDRASCEFFDLHRDPPHERSEWKSTYNPVRNSHQRMTPHKGGMPPPQKTIEIRISGRVQKVGLRNCIRRIAAKLNVRGEVMNLPDGTVKAVATADPIILEKFLSMIYGCPRAMIRDVEVQDHEPTAFDDFNIRRGGLSP